MQFRTEYILGGVITILASMKMYADEGSSWGGFPVTIPSAIIVGIFGFIIAAYGIFKKGGKEAEMQALMICIECGEKYKKINVQVHKCPKCNGDLVDL